MQRALQASPVSSQNSSPTKGENEAVMEVSPDAVAANNGEEETKNPSATDLTQQFDNMALNSQQDDPTNDTTVNADEETKSANQPKKKARKGKGAAAKGGEAKDGPATRTRGRLAAFLAQKQQD